MRGGTIQRLVVSKSKRSRAKVHSPQDLKLNAFVIPSLLCVSVGFIRSRLAALDISFVSLDPDIYCPEEISIVPRSTGNFCGCVAVKTDVRCALVNPNVNAFTK